MPNVPLPTRKRRLTDPEDRADMVRQTPAERVGMMWTLTLQAWTFAKELIGEPRLRRDVVRLTRRER